VLDGLAAKAGECVPGVEVDVAMRLAGEVSPGVEDRAGLAGRSVLDALVEARTVGVGRDVAFGAVEHARDDLVGVGGRGLGDALLDHAGGHALVVAGEKQVVGVDDRAVGGELGDHAERSAVGAVDADHAGGLVDVRALVVAVDAFVGVGCTVAGGVVEGRAADGELGGFAVVVGLGNGPRDLVGDEVEDARVVLAAAEQRVALVWEDLAGAAVGVGGGEGQLGAVDRHVLLVQAVDDGLVELAGHAAEVDLHERELRVAVVEDVRVRVQAGVHALALEERLTVSVGVEPVVPLIDPSRVLHLGEVGARGRQPVAGRVSPKRGADRGRDFGLRGARFEGLVEVRFGVAGRDDRGGDGEGQSQGQGENAPLHGSVCQSK